jgi:FkbM family methyltransferase
VSWCRGHGRAFEPETVAAFVAATKAAPECVIDVGAYTGLFTLLAHRAKAREIIAIEPNRESAARIRQNLTLNKAKATLLNGAASDHAAIGYIEVRDEQRTGLSSLAKLTTDTSAQPTLIVTVDTLPRDYRVTVIKIDVEGHELQVLKGARATIEMHHPTLIVEVKSGNGGDRRAEVSEYLSALGYGEGQVLDGRNMAFRPQR